MTKVVGGIDEASTAAAADLYSAAIDDIHRVSSPEAAELTKLLENIFRSVNIALVNELAQLCDRMNIDVWEVIEAAATKPFGFMSLPARAWPRRSLHPDRSLLPHVEGARVRLLHRVHRARGEGQRVDAVLLPLGRLAGAQPRSASGLSRARRSSSSASRTSRASPTRASRLRSSSSGSSRTRAPTSRTTTRTSPSFAENGISMSSVATRAGRVRLRRRRDGPRGDRLRPARRRVGARRRPSQRHGRERTALGQGLEALTVRDRPGRPGRVGQEPRPELRRPRRARLAQRPGRGQGGRVPGALSPRTLGGVVRRDARRPVARRVS